jgi:adenine phosphoribosyltransferase
MRKPGKLPSAVERVEYALEYGVDALEVHRDALRNAHRVLIVDDVLATGGTARAACDLIGTVGAQLVGCSFLMELIALRGCERLGTIRSRAIITY